MTPFEDDDARIGRRVFEDLGEDLGFDVAPAPPGAGVIASLDLLGGDTFAPERAHPRVRALYEQTTTLRFLDRSIEYTFLGAIAHGLYRNLIARGMQQLVTPTPDQLPDEIQASILYLDLDRDGATDHRVWVRSFEGGDVFYVGAVTVRRPSDDSPRAYLCVSLPLYQANVTFVFQPFASDGDGLTLRTRGSAASDAGVYLAFPGGRHFSMLRVPLLRDEIRIRPAGGDALEVRHRSRFFGGGFDMFYEITPK